MLPLIRHVEDFICQKEPHTPKPLLRVELSDETRAQHV